ncbi:MAG: type II toxin-antitoxin system RelE/ParE family toxin [Pseudonocardiaceae bacterium]
MELEPEVRDWLEDLSTTQFATAAFYVDLLAEHGPLLSEPYTRQLDGKLRELRFHLSGQAVRVTYWLACSSRLGCGRPGRSSGPSGRSSDVLPQRTLRTMMARSDGDVRAD